MPAWLQIAVLFGSLIWLIAVTMGEACLLAALVASGVGGGYAVASYWLVEDRENGNAAAACAVLGAAWACVVGFGAYWSSWEWFEKVDLFVIWLACLLAQAKISGLRVNLRLGARSALLQGLRLGAHVVLLLAVTAVSYAAGVLARGFSEDPRM